MSATLRDTIYGYTIIQSDKKTRENISEFTFMSIERSIQDSVCLEFWLNRLNEMLHNKDIITFPDELKQWKEEELHNFLIQHKSVDRVYFFANIKDIEFRLLLRLRYKSRPLYVEAMYIDDFAIRKSIINVSYDVQRFVDSIVCSYGERDTILDFMLYDKLEVQRPWSNVLRLEHLCQKTICSYGDTLRNDSSFKMMPILIRNEIINHLDINKIENKDERKTIMINKVSIKPRNVASFKNMLFTQTVTIDRG